MTIQITQIQIKPFQSQYKNAAEELILPIQQQEFGVSITKEDQPDLIDIPGFFQHDNGNFWIALDGNQVVGTIGLVDISNQKVALRKMFVATEYRGKEKGVARELINTAITWCKQKNVKQIFLGTTAQYHAAHRFYEKTGFILIDKNELPESFPVCHVDTRFYRYDLAV